MTCDVFLRGNAGVELLLILLAEQGIRSCAGSGLSVALLEIGEREMVVPSRAWRRLPELDMWDGWKRGVYRTDAARWRALAA